MSDRHEAFLADVFVGRITRGSGNQWSNQMDVRNNPVTQHHPFAVDGKSTYAKSISVTLEMVDKATEQAQELAPAIGLRWYPDETLRNPIDWVAIPADEFERLLADARAWRESGL
jgi:hypothetical protein